MSAQVEVNTAHRSVLSYLLSPIARAVARALRAGALRAVGFLVALATLLACSAPPNKSRQETVTARRMADVRCVCVFGNDEPVLDWQNPHMDAACRSLPKLDVPTLEDNQAAVVFVGENDVEIRVLTDPIGLRAMLPEQEGCQAGSRLHLTPDGRYIY